ncbi:5-carboxymethyl-2-hydroxymuconate semialdehyde dehydrogenase [Photobacterium makurazakiensis]|uniref:5-carboxymethyl-2-hydroxymuconate semialdehyde dehydrogenase n=1 Tax=Photobacterium makurazakiensis TaxID=2910234 RepID=UPI003D09D3A5
MIKNYINGEWVSSPTTFTTVNPATGEVLADVAQATPEQVAQACEAARAAFPAWANMPTKERAKIIDRIGDLIAENVEELSALETKDTGLPLFQTRKALVPRAADNFYFFSETSKQMNGHTYPVDDQMLNYTLYQPTGVCALISPWNVPFMTGTWKTAPCLALGNTAVMKQSELSPLTTDFLARIMEQAGVPKGVFNVVHGYGAVTGEALITNEEVNAISFTGGTSTGKRIIEKAGLKKFSMELGGKSPVMIFDDCEWERAMDAALFGIFSINGERCTAGSRIFVQSSIYDKFCEEFAHRAKNIRCGDPMDMDTKVGSLISQQHFDKVTGYIRTGIEEGATLLAGGPEKPDYLPEHLKNGHFVAPTVFRDVTNNMRIAREEIFGPVAVIIPFDDEADVVSMANDNEYGLASYLWTNNSARVHRISRQIEAGMVFVNSQNVRDLRTPFGGVKGSGTGREGGLYSFEVFTEPKNICVSLGEHHIPKWGV